MRSSCQSSISGIKISAAMKFSTYLSWAAAPVILSLCMLLSFDIIFYPLSLKKGNLPLLTEFPFFQTLLTLSFPASASVLLNIHGSSPLLLSRTLHNTPALQVFGFSYILRRARCYGLPSAGRCLSSSPYNMYRPCTLKYMYSFCLPSFSPVFSYIFEAKHVLLYIQTCLPQALRYSTR